MSQVSLDSPQIREMSVDDATRRHLQGELLQKVPDTYLTLIARTTSTIKCGVFGMSNALLFAIPDS